MKLGELRYAGLNIHSPLTDKQINLFKEYLDKLECNIFENLTMKRRIGSESLHATVWEGVVNISNVTQSIVFAIKIESVEKGESEARIGKYLSQWSDYFLITYDSIICDRIQFNQQTYSGLFIFMEFAVGDLYQFLFSNYVSSETILSYIQDVLGSLYFLGKSQLYHGDLHIKNVFIVNRKLVSQGQILRHSSQNILKAVIGDFGETVGIDSITSHLSDLHRFLTSLDETLKILNDHIDIQKKISNAVKASNRLTVVSEQKYDRWNREFVDEETGDVNLDELDKFFEETVAYNIEEIKAIFM